MPVVISRLINWVTRGGLYTTASKPRSIGAAIRNWGWTMPVLADEEGVLFYRRAHNQPATRAGTCHALWQRRRSERGLPYSKRLSNPHPA